MKTLGERVAYARQLMFDEGRSRPWSQTRLAEEINKIAGKEIVVQQNIQQVEKPDGPQNPHYLNYLPKALKQNPEWLLYGRAQPVNPTLTKTSFPSIPPTEDLSSSGSIVEGDEMADGRNELLRFFEALSPAGKSRAVEKVKSVFAEEALPLETAGNPTERRARS